MANSSERERMIGGYGSDDKVELDPGNAEIAGDDTQDTSLIPGVVADISSEPSNQDQTEPSGPAGANELGSSETSADNLAGATHQYTSGGGTTGFGKGS
jgi:hypothetical protein